MVAGGASVLHDGAVVGGEPEEAEDSGIQVTVGGAQVMDGNVRFVHGIYFREVKERGGRVSDCDDGARVKSGLGDQIVMWWRRGLGRTERAGVCDRSLKNASGTFFFHFAGRRRKDLRDTTWAAPCDNVIGAASSPQQLRVCWRYVNFYAIVQRECLGGPVFV